jgi:hypothetical protein
MLWVLTTIFLKALFAFKKSFLISKIVFPRSWEFGLRDKGGVGEKHWGNNWKSLHMHSIVCV